MLSAQSRASRPLRTQNQGNDQRHPPRGSDRVTIRVRDDNINTQEFWDLAWELEPAWRHGLGLEPDRWTVLTASLQPGMTILDIGGGRGEFLDWVGTDYHRTLFDHSRYAINHATQQGWCEQGIVGD